MFKIVAITDAGACVDVHNMRHGRGANANLMWSAKDVAWSHVDEHVLATAATNGCVVLWHVERAGQSVQRNRPSSSHQLHARAVSKVTFHPSAAHLLLSASLDACVKLLDYRVDAAAGEIESIAFRS